MNIKYLLALGFYGGQKNKIITDELLSGDGPQLRGGASVKMQLVPAVRSAQKLGLKAAVLSLHKPIRVDKNFTHRKCICLIGKMSSNNKEMVKTMIRANLPFIRELKKMNCPILVQYSDNIISEKNLLSDFYSELFAIADHIIYPSKALQLMSSNLVPKKCKTSIIHDPWQLNSPHEPRILEDNGECRIIWFGSAKNTKYLTKCLENLLKNSPQERSFELSILGLELSHIYIKTFIHKNSLKIPPNWNLRFVTWNHLEQPHQLEKEIIRAHIALIPSDPSDPRKAGVSHNRLVDALRGGCIPIASPMTSYLELEEIALLGTEMDILLAKSLQSYTNLAHTIKLKRETLLKKFSPELNAEAWEKLLVDTIKNS